MKKNSLSLILIALILAINTNAGSAYLYNNIKIDDKSNSKAVSYAIKALQKDFCRKFGNTPNPKFKDSPITFTFEIETQPSNFDEFTTKISSKHITIKGTDEIGLIHGIYNFSEKKLGIDPFIYFDGLMPKIESEIKIKTGETKSKPYSTKYRSFFLNDEDLLTGFKMEKLAYGFNLEFMQKVYETILRLQMNGVIPSTLILSDEAHLKLASDMGLYIMQHHAEPVGSVPLFWPKDRAYSWSTNKEAFIQFWTKAIERQKAKNIVWTLGFRGLLDRPFWSDDPTISDNSPAKDKAKIINEVIETQYELIKKITGNPNPIVSAVLWGPARSLFNLGLIKYPKGTMVLFADTGYGEIPETSFEKAKECKYPKGTYQHVSYHNAKAHIRINTITPETLFKQTQKVYANNMNSICVLNVGNLKEKIFGIQQMVNYLNDFDKYKNIDGEKYYTWYVENKFKTTQGTKEIAQVYKDFFTNQFDLGDKQRKPGDEFYSFFTQTTLNMLFSRKDNRNFFKSGFPKNLKDQFKKEKDFNKKFTQGMNFYSELMDSVSNKWETSMQRAYSAKGNLKGDKLDFYKIDIMFPTEKMYHLTSMTAKLSKAIKAYIEEDYHSAQLSCYAALNHAKAAIECEKKIENNHTGEFKDWYIHDQNALTWQIPQMLENLLNNIKDMKYTSLEYKYRNSKTPDLEYKMQPWFKSQYKDELFYMNNAQ